MRQQVSPPHVSRETNHLKEVCHDILDFFLLLILLGIWFCIEQHVLRVRKQTLSLEHLPAGWDGVSLLQITDLHHRQMGRGNCRIIRQAQQLQPDVIVLTGDIISRDMRDFHEISSFCRHFRK